jgi:hypothetical protein
VESAADEEWPVARLATAGAAVGAAAAQATVLLGAVRDVLELLHAVVAYLLSERHTGILVNFQRAPRERRVWWRSSRDRERTLLRTREPLRLHIILREEIWMVR